MSDATERSETVQGTSAGQSPAEASGAPATPPQSSAANAFPAPEPKASNAFNGSVSGEQAGAAPGAGEAGAGQPERPKRRILIGSQRDPAAYRPRPNLSFVLRKEQKKAERKAKVSGADALRRAPATSPQPQPAPSEARGGLASDSAVEPSSAPRAPVPIAPTPETPARVRPEAAPPPSALVIEPAVSGVQPAGPEVSGLPPGQQPGAVEASTEAVLLEQKVSPIEDDDSDLAAQDLDHQIAALDPGTLGLVAPEGSSGRRFPPPNLRGQLPPELEAEFQQAVADAPLEELIAEGESVTKAGLLEPDSQHTARVLGIHRDNVFVELGSREQGVVPLKLFPKAPEVGQTLEVRVTRFRPDEGLYELILPLSAAEIGDWSDLSEGITVEARVTGHNSGGLECEVNHIRGFIPMSQVALYRVENLEEYVGQTFPCLVTEANPLRRNLVLSRRAVLERERQQARDALWQSLAPGQIREGVVRKLMDFGAFVDLGSGVDGLLHISQMAWGRVKHPSDVLQEGQTIKIRIDKIQPETRKISLSYRDLLQNPWEDVEKKYPPNVPLRGKVTRLAEFGAFVELEPGVEGLVHISELSHRKVWRVSDVVKESDEVDVVVLSIDPQARRISLSMKHLQPKPEPAKQEAAQETAAEAPPARKPPKKPDRPLQGGLGRSLGGAQFGLKW